MASCALMMAFGANPALDFLPVELIWAWDDVPVFQNVRTPPRLPTIGDFLDEANSTDIKIVEDAPGWRSLLPLSYSRIAVHRERLGQDAHVFGIIESVSKYCDEHFKTAFKAAKLGPLTFTPA